MKDTFEHELGIVKTVFFGLVFATQYEIATVCERFLACFFGGVYTTKLDVYSREFPVKSLIRFDHV